MVVMVPFCGRYETAKKLPLSENEANTILAKKIFRLSILVYLLTNEMNIILFQINIYFVLLLLDLMTACIHQGSDSQSFWKYSGVIALQTSFEIRNLFFFLL